MWSRTHRSPWPRSWWRLLVTSRSDAASLPPPRPGRSRAATGRLRTPSCTTLTTTAPDRQAGSGVSQRRLRSDSANAPGQRQQHERRQKSRPAGSSSAAKSRSSPAVMPKRGLSPVSYWGESRDVSGVCPCASHRYCGAEQRKEGGRPLSAVSPGFSPTGIPAFAGTSWWDPGEMQTCR